MTREEAVKWIEYYIAISDYSETDDLSVAFRMAIKALEQEPDAIHNEREQAYMKGYEDASKRYRKEPCEDAISRQAVIDAIADTNVNGESLGYRLAEEIVSEIPSVTPKQKMGYWMHYEGMLYCSICGAEFYDEIMEYTGDEVPKHCPDCGANMAESEEE